MAKSAVLDVTQPQPMLTAGSPELPPAGVEPYSTVADFVDGVVLKELWAGQLLRVRGEAVDVPFDPQRARELLAQLAPSLCSDVLDAVRGWIPITEEVSPLTLLPDLDNFPSGLQDEDGLGVTQRKLLHDALEIVLDVFHERNGGEAFAVPLLPRSSIACLSAQITSMLEHLVLLRPKATGAQPLVGGLDLDNWRELCSGSRVGPPPGSKQRLVEELQECRQQMFELEKEVARQVRITENQTARVRLECAKNVQRFVVVNQTVEADLKQRDGELEAANHHIAELRLLLEHERGLNENKAAQIKSLESEIARASRLQEDLCSREREYGRQVLKLRLDEFVGMCHEGRSIKRVESAMKGQFRKGSIELPTTGDLETLARETLRRLQTEFDGFFDERQKRIQQRYVEAEAVIEEKRRETEEQHHDVLHAYQVFRSRSFNPVRNAAVQVNLPGPNDRRRSSIMAFEKLVRVPPNRKPPKVGAMMRRRSMTQGEGTLGAAAAEASFKESMGRRASKTLTGLGLEGLEREDEEDNNTELLSEEEGRAVASSASGEVVTKEDEAEGPKSIELPAASATPEEAKDASRAASKETTKEEDDDDGLWDENDEAEERVATAELMEAQARAKEDEEREEARREAAAKEALACVPEAAERPVEEAATPTPLPPVGPRAVVMGGGSMPVPQAKGEAFRSLTPSTRASSRADSRASRSSTPWQQLLQLPQQPAPQPQPQPQPQGSGPALPSPSPRTRAKSTAFGSHGPRPTVRRSVLSDILAGI